MSRTWTSPSTDTQETDTSPSLPSHEPRRSSASAGPSPVVRSTRCTTTPSAEGDARGLRKFPSKTSRCGEPRGRTTRLPLFRARDQPSQPSGADGRSSAPLGSSASRSSRRGIACPRWAKAASSRVSRRSLRTSRAPVSRATSLGTSSPAEPPGWARTTISPPASRAPRRAGSIADSTSSTTCREATGMPSAARTRATVRAAASSAAPSLTVSSHAELTGELRRAAAPPSGGRGCRHRRSDRRP